VRQITHPVGENIEEKINMDAAPAKTGGYTVKSEIA
jgi:hypothetical protein